MEESEVSLFPFGTIRDGQKEFMKDVKKTIESGGVLFAHAPTGIGKTAAVLAPAIEYATKNKKIIFFLTSKQSQHKIVIETLRRIKEKSGIAISVVDIISKQAMCPRDIAREYYATFNELCKADQKRKECKYCRDDENVVKYIRDNILHVEELKDVCTGSNLCPHKIAIDAILSSQVVVCDYNYIFSDLFEVIVERTKFSLDKIILIVDEAHNLPSRIQDGQSGKLTINTIKNVLKEVEAKNLYEYLKKIADSFEKFSKKFPAATEQNLEKSIIKKMITEILQESLSPISYEEFIKLLSIEASKRKENESMINILDFLQKWETSLPCSRIFTNSPLTFSFRLLDPSSISSSILSSTHSAILMSGTLHPVEVYKDILGSTKENTLVKGYKSPFPQENRLIIVTKNLTTLYRLRGEVMYTNIAKKIIEIGEVVKRTTNGNTAVFFPSYTFLDDVMRCVNEDELENIIVEERTMNKWQKDNLHDKLKSSKGKFLFAVQAGSFSEGVDYQNNLLKAVIVVGLPLSPPTLEIENAKNYFIKKFGQEKGIFYSYIHPAISKVLQAAGRCIRSETDTGAIVLMDYRFMDTQYKRCLPPDYNIQFSDKAEDLCQTFFQQQNSKKD